jgi:hypothetical protein
LAEGQEGRHVLVSGDAVVSIWDTFADAYQAGRERFGFGELFLAQPIEARYLTYPWPEELRPRSKKKLRDHPVLEQPLGQLGYQLLIGRDVLAACLFIHDGPASRFTLAY